MNVHLCSTYRRGAAYDWPCWCEPKVDGWRLLAVVDDAGRWRCYSREGLNLSRVCRPVLRSLSRRLPSARGLVLDGELSAGDLASTTSEVMRGRLRQARLHLWDLLSLDDWQRGRCETPIEHRRAQLVALGLDGLRLVRVVERVQVDSDKALQSYYTGQLAAGREGVVLKMTGSPWQACRDWWFKLKPGEGEDWSGRRSA